MCTAGVTGSRHRHSIHVAATQLNVIILFGHTVRSIYFHIKILIHAIMYFTNETNYLFSFFYVFKFYCAEC